MTSGREDLPAHSFWAIGPGFSWPALRAVRDERVFAGGVFVLLVRDGAALADLELLDPDERARHARLHQQQDRDNFAIGRLLVHHLVRPLVRAPQKDQELVLNPQARGPRQRSPALDSAQAPAAALELGVHGKPTLAGAAHFNLAHSGSFVACAVCALAPVGIDVETFARLEHFEDLLARVAHPRERAAVEAAPQTRRRALFERLWTRKEAVIKAVGAGFSLPLGQIDVALGEDIPCIATPAALRILDLDLERCGVAGALAVDPSVRGVDVCLLDLRGAHV